MSVCAEGANGWGTNKQMDGARVESRFGEGEIYHKGDGQLAV